MTLKEELEPIILSTAMWPLLRRAILAADGARLTDILLERVAGRTRAEDLVTVIEVAVKLSAKAMTGGNITRDDTMVLSRLCKLIGHEP